MKTEREFFEKLPEISDLVEHFDFSDDTNTYHIRYDDMDDDRKRLDVMYLGGAWYAFQEQQKKIDEVLNLVCKLQYSSGERIYSEVKELLK